MGQAALALNAKRTKDRISRLVAAALAASCVAGVVSTSRASAQVAPHRTKHSTIEVYARPDQVAALETARAQHHRVEITDLETATTTTYANPNGSLTLVSSPSPIRMLGLSGHLVPIATTFAISGQRLVANGSNPLNPSLASGVSNDLVRIGPTAYPLSVSPASGSLVGQSTCRRGGSTVRELSAGSSQAPVSAADALSGSLQPTWLGGTSVVYRDAFGSSALEYNLGTSALKESIVVPNRVAAGDGSWTFTIHGAGYRVEKDQFGSWSFIAPGGQRFVVPLSYAFDGGSSTDVGNGVAVTPVTTTVTAGRTAGTWTLTESVNTKWLDATTRRWPVTVDPTFTSTKPSGTNFNSLGSSYNASITYGNGVFTGNPAASGHPTENWDAEALFSFSGLSGKHIDAATITLKNNAGSSGSQTITAYSPTSASYTGVTGGSALTSVAVGGVGSSFTMPSSSGLVSWVTQWESQPGMNIGYAGGTNNSGTNTLKEMTPTLNVTYDTTPTVPTSTGITSGVSCPGSTANPAYVNNSFPTVCPVSTDPDAGAQLTYTVNVDTSAGVPIETVTSYLAGSSGVADATMLSNGTPLPDGSYEWQAQASNGSSSSAWSGWFNFVVHTTSPTSGISCTSTSPTITMTGQVLTEQSAAVTLNCSMTSYSSIPMGSYQYQLDANAMVTEPLSGTATAANNWLTTFTVTIPANTAGMQAISAWAVDAAGNTNQVAPSVWTVDLGYGMSQPFSGASASETVPISAIAPTGTPSNTTAKVCWAYAVNLEAPVPTNTCGAGWTNATSSVTDETTGAPWTGSVVVGQVANTVSTPISTSTTNYANPYTAPSLLLNTVAAGIVGPQAIDVEVCFTTSGTTTCAPGNQVEVLGHGFGSAMASSSVGPGELSLATGEFSLSSTDASLPGYYDDATVTRSYSSMPAQQNPGPESALGPDWSLGAPSGLNLAAYTVTDDSLTSDELVLTAPDGSQLTFEDPPGAATPQPISTPYTMVAVGAAATQQLQAVWTYDSSLSDGYDNYYTLAITDPLGTTTTWNGGTLIGNPVSFSTVANVTELQAGATSSQANPVDTWVYDSTTPTQLDAVVAAMPLSTGCPTSFSTLPLTSAELSIPEGCRILSFKYASSTTATAAARTGTTGFGSFTGQLSEIDQTQWDPNASAALTLPVECYTYDAGGYLRQVWDPRVGANFGTSPTCSGAPDLPETYSYAPSPVTYGKVNVTASPASGQVTLNWSGGPGAAYSISNGAGKTCATTNDVSPPSYCTWVSPTSVTFTGLTNGTTYAFTLTEQNAGGGTTSTQTISSKPVASGAVVTSVVWPLTTYPLQSLTPAGLDPWTFSYDSSGRLASATEGLDATDSVLGTPSSATTISYGVPIAGGGSTGLPSLNDPSTWSQSADVPVSGVAIFPPDHVPSGTPGASDWPHATIAYLDGYGRAVDTATYGDGAWTGTSYGSGWSIAAQQYGQLLGSADFNDQSSVDWSLTADNYVAAESAGSSGSAAAAQALASLNFYNTSTLNEVPIGAELLDSYGPQHYLVTSSGTVLARSHTHDVYGLDLPSTYGTYTGGQAFSLNPEGDAWQLVTSSTSGYSTTGDPTSLSDAGRAADFGSTSLPDLRTVTSYYTDVTGYGDPKLFGVPYQTVTTLASGSVTRQTLINSFGQVVEVDQPLSTRIGTTAGTLPSTFDQGATLTNYYAPGATGTCGAKPEFDGLTCQVGPSSAALAPAVGSPVPIKTTTYDWGLNPETVTVANGSTTLQVANTAHDESGRATATSLSDSVSGDVAIPDAEPVYATSTGMQTGTISVTGDTISGDTLTAPGTATASVSATFDADGRRSSYTDANGATSTFIYDVDSRVVQEYEPVTGITGGLSICSQFSGTDSLGRTEDRPVPTGEAVVIGSSCSAVSPETFSAAYDADGNATTQVYPNAMVATTTYDTAGEPTLLAYTQGGVGVNSGYGSAVMTFSEAYNAFGQVAQTTSPESSQAYAYDGLGRLTGVGDNFEGSCTTRTYGLDADSNRASFTSAATTASGGWCPTTNSAPSTQTASFDTQGSGLGGSDRTVSSTWGANTGLYAYDVLGRVTSLPSVDTGQGGSTAAGAISLTYRADGQVSSMAQGSATQSYTYGPEGSQLSTTVGGTGSGLPTGTTTYFSDGSGGPSWTTNSSGTETAMFDGLGQGNALNISAGTGVSGNCLGSPATNCNLNLADLRGNIVATASPTPGSASVTGYAEQTEFGQPRSSAAEQSVAPVYNWLGVHEKSANSLSGLIELGVRSYDPTVGRFASPDPLLGGNDGPYVYPSDPVNVSDLSGFAGVEPLADGGGEGCEIQGDPLEAEAELEDNLKWDEEHGGSHPTDAPSAGSEGDSEGESRPTRIVFETIHGAEQLDGRDGRGCSRTAAAEAVREPIDVIPQPGGRWKFVGKNATVILNSKGGLITAWARNRSGWAAQ